MTEIERSVVSTGQLARKILSKARVASILGVTSRGIFLQIAPHWVIFLSYETTRGPLTLNLDQAIRIPIKIDKTQPVEIQNGFIILSRSNIHISFIHAEEWAISPHPQPLLGPVDRNEGIWRIGKEVITERGTVGLTPVLAELLQIEGSKPLDQPAYISRIHILSLYQTLKSPDEKQVIAQLQPFLGLGSGLTPSGDDLINGFLLTYNRYSDILHPLFPLSSVNQAILALAYQKTSQLSANLIECATLGLADERLIMALDGILAGTLDPASCAQLLFSWGNSSGCDAFVGMALAAYQDL